MGSEWKEHVRSCKCQIWTCAPSALGNVILARLALRPLVAVVCLKRVRVHWNADAGAEIDDGQPFEKNGRATAYTTVQYIRMIGMMILSCPALTSCI